MCSFQVVTYIHILSNPFFILFEKFVFLIDIGLISYLIDIGWELYFQSINRIVTRSRKGLFCQLTKLVIFWRMFLLHNHNCVLVGFQILVTYKKLQLKLVEVYEVLNIILKKLWGQSQIGKFSKIEPSFWCPQVEYCFTSIYLFSRINRGDFWKHAWNLIVLLYNTIEKWVCQGFPTLHA